MDGPNGHSAPRGPLFRPAPPTGPREGDRPMDAAVRFNTPGPKRLTGPSLDSYLREVVGTPEPFTGNHDIECDKSVGDLAHKRGVWSLGCYISTKTSAFTEKELGAIEGVVENIRRRGGRVLPEDSAVIASLHRQNRATNAPALLSIFVSPPVVMMYRVHKVGARRAGDVPTWRVLGFQTRASGARCLRPVDVDVDEFSRKVFGAGIDSLKHELIGVSNMLVATKIVNGLIFSTEVQPRSPSFPKGRDAASPVVVARTEQSHPQSTEAAIQTTPILTTTAETQTEQQDTGKSSTDASTQTEPLDICKSDTRISLQLGTNSLDLRSGVLIKITDDLTLDIKLNKTQQERPDSKVLVQKPHPRAEGGDGGKPGKAESNKIKPKPKTATRKAESMQKTLPVTKPPEKRDKPPKQPQKKTLDLYGKGKTELTPSDPLAEKRELYISDSPSKRSINKIWTRRAADAMELRLPRNQQLVWLNLPLYLADQTLPNSSRLAHINNKYKAAQRLFRCGNFSRAFEILTSTAPKNVVPEMSEVLKLYPRSDSPISLVVKHGEQASEEMRISQDFLAKIVKSLENGKGLDFLVSAAKLSRQCGRARRRCARVSPRWCSTC